MKLCAYCGCECALDTCACPRCGTALPAAEERKEDATAAGAEEQRVARQRSAGLLVLARQHGFAVFLSACLLSKLRSIGEPIVLIFIGLVLAVVIALLWPAAFVGALVAVMIEGVALCVVWFRIRPFLDKVVQWDLVGEAAAGEGNDHTRIIAASRVLRLVWSRVGNWPVAVSVVLVVLLLILVHQQFEYWRRARPFRALKAEEVAAYQRKVGILIKGDAAFQLNVCNIIKLLQDRAPDKFAYVQQHVKIIKPGVWYGYVEHFDPPVICLSNDGSYSLTWQAGTLVHEAAHIQANRERDAGLKMVLGNVPASSNPNEAAEQNACDRIAAEALRELGASDDELAARGGHDDISGTEAVSAMIQAAMLADMNASDKARSNRTWSPLLEERDPALWKEWKAFSRGAPPASASKSPVGTSSNGGKSP